MTGWQPPGSTGWGAPGWGAPGWSGPPRRTNSLAVVSLVAGCAQLVFWFFGAIAAIVCGHVARSQIRRSGGTQQGSGIALAGLVLGYVGLALTMAAVTALVVFGVFFADDIALHDARQDARALGRAIQLEARLERRSPRDPELLPLVYAQVRDECCSSDEVRLASGIAIPFASIDDWRRSAWQIELRREGFGTVHVCLTVPSEPRGRVHVVDGRCIESGITAIQPQLLSSLGRLHAPLPSVASLSSLQIPSSASSRPSASTARGTAES